MTNPEHVEWVKKSSKDLRSSSLAVNAKKTRHCLRNQLSCKVIVAQP